LEDCISIRISTQSLKLSKKTKKLNERANLVFIVNGPSEDQNENYILNMQKALQGGTSKLKGFNGSTLDQLIILAKILDSEELKGKWTAISLPMEGIMLEFRDIWEKATTQ